MSVASALAAGRAAALQLMVDTCLIERKTGHTFNDVTGEYTDVWTPVHSGRCRAKPAGGGSDAQYGEHEATLRKYEIRLPWDITAEIKRNDRLTITASDDGWLIGRHLEVVDVRLTGTATCRVVTAEDRF